MLLQEIPNVIHLHCINLGSVFLDFSEVPALDLPIRDVHHLHHKGLVVPEDLRQEGYQEDSVEHTRNQSL